MMLGIQVKRPGPQDSGVVDEATAYLTGTCAQYLRRHHSDVPAWAWLNFLAHGGEDRIRNAAAGQTVDLPQGLRFRSWRMAVHLSAFEMLTCCATRGSTIAELQSMVLQPMEERLRRGGPKTAFHPMQLVATTLVALRSPSCNRQSGF